MFNAHNLYSQKSEGCKLFNWWPKYCCVPSPFETTSWRPDRWPARWPLRRRKVWPVGSGKGQLHTVRRCRFLFGSSCADIDPRRRKRSFLLPAKNILYAVAWTVKSARARAHASTHTHTHTTQTRWDAGACCLNVTFLQDKLIVSPSIFLKLRHCAQVACVKLAQIK